MSWQKQHEHVTARDLPSYSPQKCHFSYFVFPKQRQTPWPTMCPGSTGTHARLDSAPATPKAAGTAPDSQNGLTQQRCSGWILGPRGPSVLGYIYASGNQDTQNHFH